MLVLSDSALRADARDLGARRAGPKPGCSDSHPVAAIVLQEWEGRAGRNSWTEEELEGKKTGKLDLKDLEHRDWSRKTTKG